MTSDKGTDVKGVRKGVYKGVYKKYRRHELRTVKGTAVMGIAITSVPLSDVTRDVGTFLLNMDKK